MSVTTQLTAAMVDEAYQTIRPHLPATRLVETRGIQDRRLFLKLESEQPTGSFKVRGALSNLLRLPEARAGFIAASAGNHGLGVAWAASKSERREKVTIFVPTNAPLTKVQKFRQYAVDLRLVGESYDDAVRAAHAYEKQTGGHFIHAFDDPRTATGQGTVAIEIHRAIAAGTVVVPVGGGGLISGIGAWFKERHPNVRIVAVQPEASPALSESMRRGQPLLEYPAGATLADGLAGGIGHIVYDHRHLIDEVVNIPEDRIRAAIRSLHVAENIVAEASGAITVAAAGMEQSRLWPEPIVCVITGANIDASVLQAILAE